MQYSIRQKFVIGKSSRLTLKKAEVMKQAWQLANDRKPLLVVKSYIRQNLHMI